MEKYKQKNIYRKFVFQKPLLFMCLMTALLIMCSFNGYAATDKASNLKYKETDGGIVITKYNGRETSVSIPATIDGKSVVAVGKSAFAGNIFIETVTIPSSVKKIDSYAFETCSVLKTVEFADGLESIGKGSFSGCGHLTGVTLPESLKTIKDGAFFSCVGMKKITIPASLKNLGNYTFALSGITSVSIPEDTNLTKLGDRLFWRSKLKSITLPQAIKKLGKYAFAEIENLKKADLGGVKEVGKGCFWKSSDCVISSANHLQSIGEDAQVCLGKDVVLPSGLKKIAKSGCGGYATTETVTIASSVKEISGGAFSEVSPTSFEVEKGNKNYVSVDGVLFTKDRKTLVAYPAGKTASYEIPEGTETIGAYAFAGVQSLTGLTIPDSVTTIEDDAFYNVLDNDLSFTVPATVTNIGREAFRQCCMKNLTIDAAIEKTSEGMFIDAEIDELVLPENLTELSDETFLGSILNVTLPKSVEKIDRAVFLGSKGEIRTEAEGNYTVEGNLLYNAAKTELISYVNQNLEEVPEELTIADTVTKIDDYAIAAGNEINVVNVADGVTEVGKYSFGYSDPVADVANYNLAANDKDYVIYCGSQAVKDYARTNAIACFQGEAKLNLSDVTLEGDEKTQLKVENVDSADVTYTSNDESIATVSADGEVTGQRKGKTIIVAAVGHSYFRCNVTVSSDAENPFTPEIDESSYSIVTKDYFKQWESENAELNKDHVLTGTTNNLFTWYYKINNYFTALWCVQMDDDRKGEVRARIDKVTGDFGEGWEDAIKMMNHGLLVEMKRYKNLEDMVLYSGSDDISLITGLNSNITDLRGAIGMTYSLPLSTSTSLDETVPINFGDMTLIFYADKDAIDGGYIEGLFDENSGESEILLNPGTKVKILDVGVRYVKMTALTDDNESENGYHYERYVKCLLK